jgi:hypothetical protein
VVEPHGAAVPEEDLDGRRSHGCQVGGGKHESSAFVGRPQHAWIVSALEVSSEHIARHHREMHKIGTGERVLQDKV